MWCLVYSKSSVLRDLSVYTTHPSTCQMLPISESLVLSLLIHHPERQTVWNTMGIPSSISSSTWGAGTKCFLRFKLLVNIGTCIFLGALLPPLRMESPTSHNTHLFKCIPYGTRVLVYCSPLGCQHARSPRLDSQQKRKESGQFRSFTVCRGCGLKVLSCFYLECSLCSGTCGWLGFSPPLSEVRWYSNCDKVITFK